MKDDFDNWLLERHGEGDADDGRLAPGTVIGDYRVVDLLGKGGFAEVYKATDPKGTAVAIKVLHRLDDNSRSRFARESAILAQIKHPNIPRLLGFGSFGERPYMVTELLRGGDLPRGGMRIADFLKQIISAVAELHRHGYVHRDIKPANILFREDGAPVLIDFGLACPVSEVQREKDALSIENGEQLAVGTVGYSAPEQFNGQGAGPEADVHAVGSLINACFDGEKMPGNWRRIYLTATASNPRSRYQSMPELEKAISNRLWSKISAVALGVALCVGGVVLVDSWDLLLKGGGLQAGPELVDFSPNDGDDVTNRVSTVAVTVWFKAEGANVDEIDGMKSFIIDDCVEAFLTNRFEKSSSADVRRECGRRRTMRRDFKSFAADQIKQRNQGEDPEDQYKLRILDAIFEPKEESDED